MSKNEPKSNIEWKEWGKNDPLFGVATWPGKQIGGSAPWTDDEFYELGRSDWAVFEKEWKTYGLDQDTCLEIGCGAGRLTMQLARSFQNVIAVDVSEDMIAYARQRVTAGNLEFLVINGTSLPGENNSVTAVFSTHVFQHFDSLDYADLYFAEIQRILKPGGTMMIHLPVFAWHPHTPGLSRLVFQFSEWLYSLRIWLNRLLIRMGIRRTLMRLLVFPMEHLAKTLPDLGFTDAQLRILITESNHALYPFLMAKKKL
jgi:SAM-dependent methyltransferase